MLKRQSKIVSLAIIFCFCMSFMLAGFVVPQTAEAAAAYRALTAPTFSSGSVASANLSVVEVDIPSGMEASIGDVVTFSFASEVTVPMAGFATPAKGLAVVDNIIPNADFIQVYVPALHPQTGIANGLYSALAPDTVTAAQIAAMDADTDGIITDAEANAVFLGLVDFSSLTYGKSARIAATGQAVDVQIASAPTAGRGVFYVYLNGMVLNGASGDINVTVAGSSSAFPIGNVTVGKVVTGGGTSCLVKSEKSMGTDTVELDTITFIETAKGSMSSTDQVKLKLPAGFEWANAGLIAGNWNWTGLWPVGSTPTIGADTRELLVNLTPIAGKAADTAGRFDIVMSQIAVTDETVAKKGDVVIRVSGTGNVTEQDLKVANYGDFAAKGVEGTVKEIVAGKHDQKIGEFWLEETIANSLISGRQIKMSLPNGVKWSGDYDANANGLPAQPIADKGNATLGGYRTLDNYSTLACTVTQVAPPAVPSKSKFKFKDLKVDVAPDFTGPITITFSGTSGATGEIKVADVIAPVELSAENVKSVRIGEQNQELGTLIIKETKKENIARTSANIELWGDPTGTTVGGVYVAGVPDVAAADGVLSLTLPAGALWAAGYPTVEVTEGDLVLKTNDISKNGRTLEIPIKSESSTPSTITVTGLKASIDRTVPEGDFKIAVTGLAINETGGEIGNIKLAFPQYEAQKVAVAKCVTPAPDEGTAGAAAGQFKIDSNIYQLNGVAKVMDVAPYIKSGRTYVPVRYLGYVLGVAEADVVWDEGSQKVTLTKGDNVVELTIGNTTVTVNGEAQTMDVAPEITNGRTMLPARYVAEGLGYEVGWDPGSRTVLISK